MARRTARTTRSSLAPRQSKAVLDRVVAENEIVLFDPHTNKLHSLNPTASLIWRYCDGTHTISMLAARLRRSYAVSVERAESDIGRLVETMRAEGLLT